MNNFNIFYMIVAIASLVLVGLATPAKNEEEDLVDDICLGCICDAISGCNVTTTCDTNACGLFRITWIYWADMGKMTVNGESPSSPTAFVNCVNDPHCATQSLQKYMRTYKQDCNGDGKIDCYDFASIHMLGGRGCPGRIWGNYARVLKQCLGAYTFDNDYPEEFTTEIIQNSELGSGDIISDVSQAVGLQKIDSETEQIPHSEDFFEHIDNATEYSKQVTEYVPEQETEISLENTTQLPPLTILNYLRPQVNTSTTTALPIESKLNTSIGDTKRNSSETILLNSEGVPISAKFDIVSKFDDESFSPISVTDMTDDTQLKMRAVVVERTKESFSNKLEEIEKFKIKNMEEHLSLQEKFLEAFLQKNRIEEERNGILKEMARNMKTLDIESRLKQIEQSEKDQREHQLRFEEKILETFFMRNPIEEKRNEILKVATKNNKPADIAPNYFLL